MLRNLGTAILFIVTLLAVSCSGQTEAQALAQLRELTRDGKLPPESVVANIESRFSGKPTGALAKLLHARIRFDSGDYAGAAAMLNTEVFRKHTHIADHALWLRGQSLHKAGNHAEALKVLSDLLRDFPDSVRNRDAKLLWAQSSIAVGRAKEVPPMLAGLSEKNDREALLLTAKAYEAQTLQPEAIAFYRRTYFFGSGTPQGQEAQTKLVTFGQSLEPQLGPEFMMKAEWLIRAKNWTEAVNTYTDMAARFPADMSPGVQFRRISSLVNANRSGDAQTIVAQLPDNAKESGYYELVMALVKGKQWPAARQAVNEMRQRYPTGLVAKTLVDAGAAARDAKNAAEAGYYFNAALTSFPNAVEVAQAQFEAAWLKHEARNYGSSSQMFIEHLARYVDKDNTNRGKAGYWAARDSERVGKIAEACALYDAVNYRYGANWYGYLAFSRLTTLKNQGQCRATAPPNEQVAKAAANLKVVTVAAETATEKEIARAEKSEELSTIGLFDWAIDELNEAKKTATNSPKINLALAKHYRLKGDQVNALLSLAKSYPDYAQMFPEEMGREEWDIFYPLTNWADIKKWSAARGLDKYQVAGIIRQETIFDARARSHANAYGLMQLLLPTARTTARKYGSTMPSSGEELYDPSLNIELGTAYMKDQFDKFGRFEYVGIAYNAGPGRVAPWRASLPVEMDEFVEAIPFKETKGYVQGIIRNTAQYRRLYDENGNFKPNVGTKPLRSEIDSKPRDEFVAQYPDIALDDNTAE